MVLGAHQQPPSLLVQQEGVVAGAVSQAVEGHQVAGLQHLCRGETKETCEEKRGAKSQGNSSKRSDAEFDLQLKQN